MAELTHRETARVHGPQAMRAMEGYIRASNHRAVQAGRPDMYDSRILESCMTNPEVASMVKEHAESQSIDDLRSAKESYEQAKKAVLRERDAYVEMQVALMKDMESVLARLRDLRMAISVETRTVMADLQAMNEIMASSSSVEARAGAKEICELAERFAELQRQGVLDTILKAVAR